MVFGFIFCNFFILSCLSAEDLLLQEDLLKILPMINEANAMSEELDKKVNNPFVFLFVFLMIKKLLILF